MVRNLSLNSLILSRVPGLDDRGITETMQNAIAHEELQYLLEKIYRERGFDFREYRKATLIRRLDRRLRARGAHTYTGYAHVLDIDPDEYEKLFDDITINVTSFFRDEVAFKALEKVALPVLIRRMGTRRCLRIWSAGCATGQEPYSVAMLLLQMLGQEIGQWDITILATDIDNKALARAREGYFTLKDVEDIQPGLLNECFAAEDGGFHAQSILKELVTFEAHNLVSHPLYSDLCLVLCRNVLIYFTPLLQMRVLKGFHQGLKAGGFLLLGKAEAPVGETKQLFHRVDDKAKLYQKLG